VREYVIRVRVEVVHNELPPLTSEEIEEALLDHVDGEVGIPWSGVPRRKILLYSVQDIEETW
jgi:hypothetical protein